MLIKMQAICALAIAGLTLGFSAPLQADSLTVKTAQGRVQGKTINEGKVKAFLGLPYAAPPVGDLRWKAPEPPAKWKDLRDGTHYGARCFQYVFADMVFQDAGPSEDCLYLNVFTPASAKAGSKLPVMFWIHGGGYAGGSASEPRHNGDFLPLKGVVLVTINYRLGVFGFLATSDLAKEADGPTGNYGLLDMVAALQWVKANIAQFGGDPGNVTIFGESAGSFAVSTLMAAAPAQGLFQKAIGESGGAFSDALPTQTREAPRNAVRHGSSRWVRPLLRSSRAMPAHALIDAAAKTARRIFEVVLDSSLLTEPVPETYAKGKQAHVPLLAGWNRDENTSLAKDMTAEKWKAFAVEHFTDGQKSFQTLPGDTDEQATRSPPTTAAMHGSPSAPGSGLRRNGKPAVHPSTATTSNWPHRPVNSIPDAIAFHSDDIEYVFGTLDTRPGAVWRPEDRKLSEQMMSYWTNFARTGDPNGEGLPELAEVWRGKQDHPPRQPDYIGPKQGRATL